MKTHLFLLIAFVFIIVSGSAQNNKASVSLTAAIYEEEITGNLDKAVELYLNILKKYPDDRQVAAKTLYHLGLVNEKMGEQKANEYFTRLVNTYPDQTEVVALAKAKLASLGNGAASKSSEVAMHRIWNAEKNWPFGFSPNGRWVVYTSSDDYELWLRDLQSGEKKRITCETSWVDWTYADGDAVISPDGKQIVYSWYVRSYGELRVSALDGSSMKVLQSGIEGRSMFPHAWMPDGRHILVVSFDRKDNNYRRHIISLADGTIRDIGQPDKRYIDWAYPTADGHYIGYNIDGNIFICNTSTGQDSALFQNPANDDLMLGWTPDGSGIIFLSNRSGTNDLYLMKMRNGRSHGDLELLRKDLGANKDFSLTKDGKLFWIENTSSSNSYIIQVNGKTGSLTGTPSPVDANYPNIQWPAWSSDGKFLYYSMSKMISNIPAMTLFMHDEETGLTREIKLNPEPKSWYRPILSPDGRRFAITGTGENLNFGIWAVDSDNGNVNQLVKIPTENSPIDPSQNWSPDGKAIYYKVRSLEKSEGFIIRRKDLTTGEEKDIYEGINTMGMKISPDGTRFVYSRTDRPTKSYVLGILDMQTGKEQELWRVPEADSPYISDPLWAPDGESVMVTKNLKRGSELWRFPAVGGSGEKIYSSSVSNFAFSMHPSGERVAFIQKQSNYEVWVLENFLPK